MAKIILTEAQLRNIIIEEKMNSGELVGEPLFNYLLTESFNRNDFIKYLRRAIAIGTITLASACSYIDRIGNMSNDVKEQLKIELQAAKERQNLHTQKVNACKQYMEWAAKNVNMNPKDIQLDPDVLVSACEESNFDLPLAMAQAHMESCFGLTPRAKSTNSVFSVGLYDSGQNAVTYENQNASVKPYIRLMKNNYLVDKSIDQLLTPGSFVNQDNKRYASSKTYENDIKSIRNRILRMYPELGK